MAFVLFGSCVNGVSPIWSVDVEHGRRNDDDRAFPCRVTRSVSLSYQSIRSMCCNVACHDMSWFHLCSNVTICACRVLFRDALRWMMKVHGPQLVLVLFLAPNRGSVVGEIEQDSFFRKSKTK